MVEVSPGCRVHGSHCPVVHYLGLVTVLCVLPHFPLLCWGHKQHMPGWVPVAFKASKEGNNCLMPGILEIGRGRKKKTGLSGLTSRA